MFTQHAKDQMSDRGIPETNALAVLQNATKIEPSRDGCTNYWGYGPMSGYRIRVTVAADGRVVTVAWADSRK